MNKQGSSFSLLSVFPFFCLVLFSTTAVANSLTTRDGRTEIRLSTGILNGNSGEYVYDANGTASGIKGYKISELDWDLGDVPMLGVGLSFPLTEKFKLNFDYWKNAVDGDGTMDDYDWLYVGAPWSHWSHHEDTTVREVSSLDGSAEFSLYRFNADRTELYGMIGYRQDHLDWQAKGGYGIYSVSSYRDTYVIFPDVPVISYEQTYTTPYLGLGIESSGRARGTDIILTAHLRYSQWVQGEDEDIHHLRDLRFEVDGDNGEWIGADLGVTFELSPQWSLNLGYAYQEYREIKSSTKVTDLTTGSTTVYSGDSAGLDHTSKMWTLGANYRF